MSQFTLFSGYFTMVMTSLPIIIIAIIFIVMAMRNRRKQRAARDWPTTTGQVLESDIQVRKYSGGAAGGRTTSYYAHVVYQYRVNGSDYRSDRISPSAEVGNGSSSRAMARAGRYPVGAQVTVMYNPLDPNEAVLELTAPRMRLQYMIGGCLLLFLLYSLAMSFGILRFTSAVVGAVSN